MEKRMEKPLSFGEILDLTFRIIKENFAKLFLLVFIVMGPVIILQSIGMYLGGASIVQTPQDFLNFDSYLQGQAGYGQELFTNTSSIVMLLISIFLYLIAIPISLASIIYAVGHAKKGEEIELKSTLKRALSRFWPLFGSIVVYNLIIGGFVIVSSILFSISFGISVAINSFSIMIILGLILFLVSTYLLTRWSFFFAATTYEKVSPGLSKSWNLTRGKFWRVFGLFLVLLIIVGIISNVLSAVIQLLLGFSVITNLLSSIVSILEILMMYAAYAIIYLDLRVRNEAIDLQEMVESYSNSEEEQIVNNDNNPNKEI